MNRTYGKLWLDPETKLWTVKAEPHIMIKLKQVFGKVDKGQFGHVTLFDSDEVRRDLEWFLSRYDLEVADKDWGHLLDGSERHKAEVGELESIMAPDYKAPAFAMALPPRDYQAQVAEIVWKRGFLLVGDQVGLGKTVETIACFTNPDTLPALVVTLAGILPSQWEKEVNRFMPGLTTHVIKKTKPYPFPLKNGKPPDVLITSYSKLHGWAEHLAGKLKMIGFDEAQELRHNTSNKYKAAKHIARTCKFTCGLSVGPDSMILVRSGNITQHMRIDDFAEANGVIDDIFTPVEDYEVRSFNGTQFCWKPIKAVLKHRPEGKKTFRISTEKGRSLVLTEDHSIYRVTTKELVWVGSKKKPLINLEEAKGADLRVGDHVLLEDYIKSDRYISHLSVVDFITASDWYVAGDFEGWISENINSTYRTKYYVQQRHKQKHRGPYGPYVTSEQFMSSEALKKYGGKIYTRGKGHIWTNSTIPVEDIAYILGFFVGDGWVSESRICFAVESDRVREFLKKMCPLLKWTKVNISIRRMKGASVEIRFSNLILSNFFRGVFRNARAWEKQIPEEAFSFDEENTRRFIQGMLDSDGSLYFNGDKNRAYWSYCTTSSELAYGMVELLKKVDVIAGVYITKCDGSGGVINGRKITSKRDRFTVQFSMNEWFGKNDGMKGRRSRFESNGISGYPVKIKTISEEPCDFVYDISVDSDTWQTFVASGVLVHNSATPIFGYGGEIYNVVDVLRENILGAPDEFFREWCSTAFGERKVSIRDPRAFGTYLREQFIMIRRTRSDVGRELPAIQRIPHRIASDRSALDSVKESAAALAKIILSTQKLSGFERMKAAEEFSHLLRQATGVAKAPYVADFVRMMAMDGDKVVVFAWHREVYQVLLSKLQDLNPVMITGAESEKQKLEAKKRFVSGDSKVLFISLRAGQGIDGLQDVSSIAVFAELDWAPGISEQCIGRLHRDGQKKPVTAFFLLADEGSDPTIAEALGLKAEQLEGIRNPDAPLVEDLQIDEDHVKTLAKQYLEKEQEKAENPEEPEEADPEDTETETPIAEDLAQQ